MRRFDLPYMALPLPTDILRAWEHPPSASALGLALPQRNHFIPTDFSLRAPTAESGKDARAKQAAEAILTAVPDLAAKVCLLHFALLVPAAVYMHACLADARKSSRALKAEKAMMTVHNGDAQIGHIAKRHSTMGRPDAPHLCAICAPKIEMPNGLSWALQHCVGNCQVSSVRADIWHALSSSRGDLPPLGSSPDLNAEALWL